METHKTAYDGNCFVFCMVPNGTKPVPNATLLGMECQDSPRAQRGCGSATDLGAGSCLRSRHRCRCLCCRRHWSNRLSNRLRCLVCCWLAYAQSRGDLLCFRRLQKLLEVTVFRKHIGKRLLDNIVGRSANEGGVLIDLHCG